MLFTMLALFESIGLLSFELEARGEAAWLKLIKGSSVSFLTCSAFYMLNLFSSVLKMVRLPICLKMLDLFFDGLASFALSLIELLIGISSEKENSCD